MWQTFGHLMKMKFIYLFNYAIMLQVPCQYSKLIIQLIDHYFPKQEQAF